MKKEKIIVLVITLILMVSLIIGASYAYFSVVRVNANIAVGNLSGISYTISLPAELNFTTNPYYPVNETVLGISSPTSITVQLTNNSPGNITCGYEIIYQPAIGSDTFVLSPDNTENLPELVIEGEDSIGGSDGENSHFAFDLRNKAAGSSYTITHGTISANASASKTQTIQFQIVYYNYDFEQQINANKNIKGTIRVQSTGCVDGTTAYLKVLSLVGSSNTDSSSNPWTVKNENGYRYEGKNPNNYICFKDSCTSAYMYRIIGIMEDEAKDGDTYYTGKLLKVMKSSYSHQSTFGTIGDWSVSHAREVLNNTYITTEAVVNVANKMLTTKWYLTSPSSSSVTPATYYEKERLTGVKYSDSWPLYSYDKIGFIYGSDFLYGSYETGSCNHASSYSDTYASNCKNSNYLFKSVNYYTISPSGAYNNRVRYISSTGTTTTVATTSNYYYYPTFHLPSNVVLSGTGTFDDPYKIVW